MPSKKLVVFNPMGYPPAIRPLKMAPRPASLEGKTVYLVDMRFDDADLLLEQMRAWFVAHMPGVKTKFVRKAGVYAEDDLPLFEEIKAKGDAAILAVGH